MNIKKLLGNEAHWTLNKHLTKELGLVPTLLLQHLIDLQTSFFKNGHFFQKQEDIAEVLGIGVKSLRTARTVLSDKGLIEYKRGHQALYYYSVNIDVVYKMFEVDQEQSSKRTKDTFEEAPGIPHTLTIKDNKNKDNNNININKWDKLYAMLIEGYPKNRVQSKNPVTKLLQELNKEQLKLVIENKNRYLKVAGKYVKNLRKYIEEECWSEEWLKAEEGNKKQNGRITLDDVKNNLEDDWS